MSYEEKYLKYKNKYLSLKNLQQYGGAQAGARFPKGTKVGWGGDAWTVNEATVNNNEGGIWYYNLAPAGRQDDWRIIRHNIPENEIVIYERGNQHTGHGGASGGGGPRLQNGFDWVNYFVKPRPQAAAPQRQAVAPQPQAPQPLAAAPQPLAAAPQRQAVAPQPLAAAPQPQAVAPQAGARFPKGTKVGWGGDAWTVNDATVNNNEGGIWYYNLAPAGRQDDWRIIRHNIPENEIVIYERGNQHTGHGGASGGGGPRLQNGFDWVKHLPGMLKK